MTEEKPAPSYVSRRWPLRRLLRAAYLAGHGLSYAEIAQDEFVRSTSEAVRRNLNRFGVRLRDAPRENMRINISSKSMGTFDAAGAARGVTPDVMVERAVAILGADPALLQNVLDDQ
jgi:hypothetical protein